jgi:hypothetical protein
MVGKRVKCPACSAVVSIDPPRKIEEKPSTPTGKGIGDSPPATAEVRSVPSPNAEGPSPAQPTEARNSASGVMQPRRTPSGSIIKALALSCLVAAVVFVITFLAGGLTAFLMPIVKSLQGEESKSLFQIAWFAFLGLWFIGSFLTFILLPLFLTGAACASAGEEMGEGSSRPRHIAAALAVTLLSAGLVWVLLPWVQYYPHRTAEWAESTITTYRLVYVIANVAIGLIFAAKAGSPKQQPVASGAATSRDGV